MLSLTIIAGFFVMLFLPCAFAVFSSRDREEKKVGLNLNRSSAGPSAGWRTPRPAAPGSYDLVPAQDPAMLQPRSSRTHTAKPASGSILRRPRGTSTLLGLAAEAEAQSLAAQIHAAQANKAALEAIARSAAARAAAATALASEAQRAVAEAGRVADAVRRAYETAPPSIGPERHALPETHPSMDFPRSHVIRRAA